MNSRFYRNGALDLNLNDYLKVFGAIKRELDLNDDDDRYDVAIEDSIADNAYRLAKEELFPNQRLTTTFAIDNMIYPMPLEQIELSAISRVLNVRVLDKDGKVITNSVPMFDNECGCGSDSMVSYTIDGNLLLLNNLETLGKNSGYSIQLLTNGGNLAYWFGRGWRLLTQLVKSDLYLNYFKAVQEAMAAQNSYQQLYRDLEKQTYDLYDTSIRVNRDYW